MDRPRWGKPRLYTAILGRDARWQNLFDVDLGGILSRIAGRAVGGFLAIRARFFETFDREIGKRVGDDETANLVDGFVGRDQFFFRRRVHSVEAGRDGRRAGNPHVDFFRAGVANHADNFLAGGAAHNGVIDQNDSLARDKAADGVEFQLHTKVAHGLLRLNKSTSDVVIANKPEPKRNAALGGIADGRRIARIRNGNDDIGIDRRFTRQLATHGITALIDRATENDAVGTRKINVLKDAARQRRGWRIKT